MCGELERHERNETTAGSDQTTRVAFFWPATWGKPEGTVGSWPTGGRR
jgi:hypothetical protein